MAKEIPFKYCTAEVIEDKSEGAEFVKGRVLVKKDGLEVAVVVPFNEPAPKTGDKINIAYIEEPVLGGLKIVHAKLVKPEKK